MIEHCVLKLKRQAERKALITYVTDALYAISENTYYKVGLNGALEAGRRLSKRWIEAAGELQEKAAGEPEKQEDERSCGEIAADMWARMRGRRRK